MESEFWPIILDETKKYGVKQYCLMEECLTNLLKIGVTLNFFSKK